MLSARANQGLGGLASAEEVLPRGRAAPGLLLRTTHDLIALTKPGIVAFCAGETASGLWLAGGATRWGECGAVVVGTGLAVAAANTLNMVVERDTDRLMQRTRHRPLPAGRLRVRSALLLALVCLTVGLSLLALVVNPLTALLAALALAIYVLAYTPLKRISHHALLVGAVAGAMPALIGWTASKGSLGAAGFALFALMACWQLPHFASIALYRSAEYARAGIRALPLVIGADGARRYALLTTALLLPLALAVGDFGGLRLPSRALLLAGGALLLWRGLACLGPRSGPRGARSFFAATLLYLPVLWAGLALQVILP
ncbi:MAG: protoheme IX farnesyltransferase [Proteobacteria bacterium]|nr:protoheme IX farnesyltransferase [Pseudomonadota bacterium]